MSQRMPLALRTERDTDADFVGAAGRGVGHDSVESYANKDAGQHTEGSGEFGDHSVREERIGKALVHAFYRDWR